MRTPEPRFERVEHNFVSEALAGAKHIIVTIPLRQMIVRKQAGKSAQPETNPAKFSSFHAVQTPAFGVRAIS